MFALPGKYVLMVSKSWGRAISGPILVVVGLVLALLQQTVTDGPTAATALKCGTWVTLGIAAVMILVAQYKVWKREYETRNNAEEQLNAKADMRGTIVVAILQYNPLQDQSRGGSGLRFACDCANHGSKSCEISKVCLLLSGPDFKEPLRLEQSLLQTSVRVVGPGQQFRLEGGAFTILDVRQSALRRSTITIHLVDSLGTEYQNTVTRIVPSVTEVP